MDSSLKFVGSEFEDNDIASLSDTPNLDGMTAADLKARFDNIGKMMIALGKHNDLVDALTNGTAAAGLGAVDSDGNDTTVQALLDTLANSVLAFSESTGAQQIGATDYGLGTESNVQAVLDRLSQNLALMIPYQQLASASGAGYVGASDPDGNLTTAQEYFDDISGEIEQLAGDASLTEEPTANLLDASTFWPYRLQGFSYSYGKLTLTSGATQTNQLAAALFNFSVGKTYSIHFKMATTSGTPYLAVSTRSGASKGNIGSYVAAITTKTADGEYTVSYTPSAASNAVVFQIVNNNSVEVRTVEVSELMISETALSYYVPHLTAADYTARAAAAENVSTIADAAAKSLMIYGTNVTDSTFTGGKTILDLPNNRIFKVMSLTDYSSAGLPVNGPGTAVKFSPNAVGNAQLGFSVYLFANSSSAYIAFTSNSQTIPLSWSRLYTETDAAAKQDVLTFDSVPTEDSTNPVTSGGVFDFARNKGIADLGISALKIAFIGDSIIEGYGTSDYNGGESGTSGELVPNNEGLVYYRNTGAKCWVNQMIAYLSTNYSSVTAVNNGIGGINAQRVLDSIDKLATDGNGNLVNVAVVSVGTNNRSTTNKITNFIEPLKEIIAWLEENGIQPIILTNTPTVGDTAPNNAPTIQSCIIRACNEMGVPCYDLMSRFNYYLWDHGTSISDVITVPQSGIGIHPNDAGHAIMFEMIKRMFRI